MDSDSWRTGCQSIAWIDLHDIAIPTKDLGSGLQELQLWMFALIDLLVTSGGTQSHHADKLHF